MSTREVAKGPRATSMATAAANWQWLVTRVILSLLDRLAICAPLITHRGSTAAAQSTNPINPRFSAVNWWRMESARAPRVARNMGSVRGEDK